jgi:EcsC protein family
MPTISMPETALRELAEAKRRLENPNFAIKLTAMAGEPSDALLRRLPPKANAIVSRGTRRALDAALGAALSTMDPRWRGTASDWLHRGIVIGTGAAGGVLGLGGLVVELPVSTTVMLRSIADHARAQGEDLASAETRMQCLAVFAMGGPRRSDDAGEAGYLAVRAALGRLVSEAAEYVTERSLAGVAAEKTAPALVRFLAAVAQRFGLVVTEKAAAQIVPVLGAAGGAAVNAAFMHHYQAMGSGHFTVRRLERSYGVETVRDAYQAIGATERTTP